MLWLQLSIMQILLPVKLGRIEKLFRVYGIQYLHALKVLVSEHCKSQLLLRVKGFYNEH